MSDLLHSVKLSTFVLFWWKMILLVVAKHLQDSLVIREVDKLYLFWAAIYKTNAKLILNISSFKKNNKEVRETTNKKTANIEGCLYFLFNPVTCVVFIICLFLLLLLFGKVFNRIRKGFPLENSEMKFVVKQWIGSSYLFCKKTDK